MKKQTKINKAILHFDQKSQDLHELACILKNDFMQIKGDRDEMMSRLMAISCELKFIQTAFDEVLKASGINFNLKP